MIREDVLASMQDPEYPIDYGFHYSNSLGMIKQCVAVLELFKKWPEPGGLLDQDAFLVDDMLTYKAIKNVKRKEYENLKNG